MNWGPSSSFPSTVTQIETAQGASFNGSMTYSPETTAEAGAIEVIIMIRVDSVHDMSFFILQLPQSELHGSIRKS